MGISSRAALLTCLGGLAVAGCKRSQPPKYPVRPTVAEPTSEGHPARYPRPEEGNRSPSPRVRLTGAKAPESKEGQKEDAAAQSPEIARPICQAVADRLEAAEKAFDDRDYELALTCAEDELLDDPASAAAEQERAAALSALGRTDEARLAYAHALALDPDDPQILLGAADLYLSRGAQSREFDEIALEYARRGERRARRHHAELLEQLELLQGMALNDLGRCGEALPKLDEALQREPKDLDARYERGVALFELCRFGEAQSELKLLLATLPEDAYAHHQLGLVLERLGEPRAAQAELARATELDGKAFPTPLSCSPADFQKMVSSAVAELPQAVRADLSLASVSVQDLPDLGDLTVDDPPLSPTILGLFRGEPLGDGGQPLREARAIVLYRQNLVRVVRSKEELEKQVKLTLWHELGHLRGADDDELRLRGLE